MKGAGKPSVCKAAILTSLVILAALVACLGPLPTPPAQYSKRIILQYAFRLPARVGKRYKAASSANSSTASKKRSTGKPTGERPTLKTTSRVPPGETSKPDKKNKKQKSASRATNTRKQQPKEPKPKRTPLTPEAKKERQRTRFKERLEEAKALGLCRHCREPAIEGQTRCESCAERHREGYRRQRGTTKQPEEKLPQELAELASSKATAQQAEQQAEHRKPETVTRASKPTARQEYERLRNQQPERKELRRRNNRERTKRRKAAGLCKECPNSSILGQTRCDECAERQRKYKVARAARKRAELNGAISAP